MLLDKLYELYEHSQLIPRALCVILLFVNHPSKPGYDVIGPDFGCSSSSAILQLFYHCPNFLLVWYIIPIIKRFNVDGNRVPRWGYLPI